MQHIDSGLDVKPTISCTKAHIKMTELDLANSTGSIEVDGKIVTKSQILPAFPENDPGIEVNTYKAAIEPVWHLPGLAKRFDVSEELLRRALFEGMSFLLSFLLKTWTGKKKRRGWYTETGGMYPELLTRRDLETFLPPIGGQTVYIFGNPAFLRDPTKELTVRVHDECNGSDVLYVVSPSALLSSPFEIEKME
jgi:GTP cyclohydrolase II